jgi:FixJ family two-component response regulator
MVEPVLICIVDNDTGVLDSLTDFLCAAGYRTAGFASAESFLESAERELCACVVADIDMPRLTGIDLAKSVAMTTAAPKVILITGRIEESWRRRAMDSGAAGFLQKPIEAKTLLSLLERSLAA